jgi:tetratricopeptide (TPR) repeat protein
LISVLAIFCAVSAAATTVQADTADLDAARSLVTDHQYDDAMAAVDEYLIQKPNDPAATIVKSDIYMAWGEWDRSVDVLEGALSKNENNIDLLLALATTYRAKLMRSGMLGKLSNAKKSKKALEKAYAVDPNDLLARRQMFMYLVHAPGMAGGDKDRAGKIALESLEIDEFEGRVQLATLYWKKGDRDASAEEYRRALELEPDDIDAMFMLGGVLIEKEDFAACEQLAQSFITSWPDMSEPYVGLGNCYKEQKRTEEATEQYLKALELNPWYGDARYNVARIYEKNKDKEQAAYHYRILIERNPGYIDVGKAKKQLRKIEKGR